jgi:hypothetical protein
MRKPKIEGPAMKMVRIDFRTQIQVPVTMSDKDAIARYLKRMTPPIKPPGRLPKEKPIPDPEELKDPDDPDNIDGFEPVPVEEESEEEEE